MTSQAELTRHAVNRNAVEALLLDWAGFGDDAIAVLIDCAEECGQATLGCTNGHQYTVLVTDDGLYAAFEDGVQL